MLQGLKLAYIGAPILFFVLALYTYAKVKPKYTNRIIIITIIITILFGLAIGMLSWFLLNLYYISTYGERQNY
ncbi:MAG: hypothetical protein GXO43_01620 [Crenarchaeota archaeon]|nr:hypothetical protein [Thermoproteota archaeon]